MQFQIFDRRGERLESLMISFSTDGGIRFGSARVILLTTGSVVRTT